MLFFPLIFGPINEILKYSAIHNTKQYTNKHTSTQRSLLRNSKVDIPAPASLSKTACFYRWIFTTWCVPGCHKKLWWWRPSYHLETPIFIGFGGGRTVLHDWNEESWPIDVTRYDQRNLFSLEIRNRVQLNSNIQGIQNKMSHEINKYTIAHHFFSNIIIVCVSPISSPSNNNWSPNCRDMVHLVTTMQIPP